MDFPKFIEWAFLGLLGGCVYILWGMKTSIDSLHSDVKVLIRDRDKTEEKLGDHEFRIRNLERNT